MTLLVRVAGDAEALIASIPKLAREIDPAMPLLGVEPLSVRVAAATQQERLVALLSTLFGALALTLAAVGLYGVVSYTVTQRSAEFGVRLALGASPGRLERLVLRQSLALVSIGLAAGIAIAVAGARALSHSLFGVSIFDPLSFCSAGAILLIVGATAAHLPSRRAAKSDPIAALRHE
jgi:putative ABC transport system permease protein